MASHLSPSSRAAGGRGALGLRIASHADAPALDRLAELDSSTRLRGPALMASLDGRAIAALDLTDGRVVADPFERSAAAVALLRMRAGQLASSFGPRRRRGLGGTRLTAVG